MEKAKRAVKSKVDMKEELELQANKNFLEEYKALVEPLNEKYGRRLVPIMNYTEQGSFPVFGIQKIVKDIINVEKRKEPETNG